MTTPDTLVAAASKHGSESKHTAAPHFTPAERIARGRAERAEVPRSSHHMFEPASNRRDPIELLEEQAESRVAELVPIRYGRMLASAFAFYRGGAYLMAADLAGLPRTGLHVQLLGDAHLSNFGTFAAPDRRLVFSVNDFDETLPGPFEWDLKRLAASIAVAGRDRGFDDAPRRAAVLATLREYREAMRAFATMGNLEVWYTRLDVDAILKRWGNEVNAKDRKSFRSRVERSQAKDNLRALDKLTHVVDGERRIISDPPLIVPVDELGLAEDRREVEEKLRTYIRAYRSKLPHDRCTLLERYRFVQAARKVVGVGSVGTRAWILLLIGRDEGDPLFLQLKQAQESVLEPFLGKSEWPTHGQRVVEGQRLMQATSDIMLGWERGQGPDGETRDFYIRQLWDGKGSADVARMSPRLLSAYGRICGWTLARAHARSGDALAISAYLGRGDVFERAVAEFAEEYADQNERDYRALQDAAASGRVAVQTGI